MTEGLPKIALIHAALGRGASWRRFVDALDLDVLPVEIELPGHGDAEEWDKSRDYADQALEIALSEMPAEPVPLIGHSFGAVLALRLAVERPWRVSSLVLVEPVFFAAVKGSWSYQKALQDYDPVRKKIKDAQLATAARSFYELWGDGAPWSELLEPQKRYMMQRIETVPAGDTLLYEDRPGLLKPGRIEHLDMPVTFVDGGMSPPVIAEIINALGPRIPDAEWVTVPEAGHMVPITHADVMAEAVRDRIVWPEDEDA